MTVEQATIRMRLCFDHALSPEEQQQIETRIAHLLHAADSGAILELVRFEGEPGCPTRMTATILAASAIGERLREAFGSVLRGCTRLSQAESCKISELICK